MYKRLCIHNPDVYKIETYNLTGLSNFMRFMKLFCIISTKLQKLLQRTLGKKTPYSDGKSRQRRSKREDETQRQWKRQSPRTESHTAYIIFGSVLTWHSYLPESVFLALFSLRVQASLPGVCCGPNRASELNAKFPEVRMCRSLLLIHETWGQNRE